MLALRSAKNEIENEMEKNYSAIEDQDIMDFAGGINLLDSIDFDDLFVGINDGDLLPDLEMDPREILAEFPCEGEESMSDVNMTSMVIMFEDDQTNNNNNNNNTSSGGSNSYAVVEMGKTGSGSTSPRGSEEEEEAVSKKDFNPSPPKEGEKGRKSTKNPHGKRKVKVDWTPELHRRFVQAVEQLGVDKAVPSRILELMGIDCLTRHNIASHLQKYRSHRKHLLAREAEAASWSQRRQVYGGGVAPKRPHHWIAPTTMGFPHHFRPLHVWGHPSVDQSIMPMWPPPPAHHPPSDHPSYWVPHPHHHNVPTPGTPCFPPHTRFPTPPVHGIPPPGMYKVEHAGVGVAPRQTLPQPPADVHPSKESVDAAIGDVLTKPWLPLPLGLKPPSMDSVMVELQRQGIPKIPPTCA